MSGRKSAAAAVLVFPVASAPIMLWLGHAKAAAASNHTANHRVKLLFFMSFLHCQPRLQERPSLHGSLLRREYFCAAKGMSITSEVMACAGSASAVRSFRLGRAESLGSRVRKFERGQSSP